MSVPQPTAPFGRLGLVCRLGLAAHMNGSLEPRDVHFALDRGINFLNWPGSPDYLSRAVAELGPRRERVFVCVQFEARTARDAETELAGILRELHSDYVDVVTFYYVEEASEWEQIIGPGGALEACRRAQEQGKIRLLGVTSHQRPLAASMAHSGLIDMLMIRYNAAHRGAETEIFPATSELGMPVVTYTSLRWRALLERTPDDPPGFQPPPAPQWYRFALQHPAATFVLTAPNTRQELEEDLTVIEKWGPLGSGEYDKLAEHGKRVRRHAGRFP
jgi:predicted aldo/keto reductase-like oxidoreductase